MSYTNGFKLIIPLTVAAVILVLSSVPASAFSLPEWLGFGDKEKETSESASESVSEPKSVNWGESSARRTIVAAQDPSSQGKGSGKLQFDEVEFIVSNLNAEQREKLLSDETAFNSFVRQQAVERAVLSAARASRIEEEPLVQLLIRKSSENALREIYVKRMIEKELLSDPPSEEQAKVFYDDNREKFTLEERVHLWQIFLPFGEESVDSKTKEAVKKKANDLKRKIDSNTISFADAATQYSQHIPSRYAGGYMGLVKLSEIKPELKERVLSLQENNVSEPILGAADDGYHLIKRGSRVAGETLPYEQVKKRVYQMVRKEKEDRLRRVIAEQSSEAYSQGLDSNRIEQWRLKLRTDLYKGGGG